MAIDVSTYVDINIFLEEKIMAKGSSRSKGGGRPAPIPTNNGPNPAGWPSTTRNLSGGDRNNALPVEHKKIQQYYTKY